MNNSEIIKGKNVKKYLDRALKNGWKIAKRIDFHNTDMYNYHLVPVSGDDGYICMWCKGNEFEAQYNTEKYHDDNYKGETLYETGYNKSTLYMGRGYAYIQWNTREKNSDHNEITEQQEIFADDKELYSEMFGEDYGGFEEGVPSASQTIIKEV